MNVALFSESTNYHYSGQSSITEVIESEHCEWFYALNVDTEFEQNHHDYNRPVGSARIATNITIQTKSITDSKGMIFTHPDCRSIARHPVMESQFFVVDYLKVKGLDAKLINYSSSVPYVPGDKTLQIDLYAHFAIAELFRICNGSFKQEILNLCLGRRKKNIIKQGRRLIAENTLRTGVTQQWVSMDKFLLEINGTRFHLRLRFFDTVAIFGQQSLKNLAVLAGHTLDAKDHFTNEQKEHMTRMYVEHPEKFDEYALGDLDVYPILLKAEKRVKKIYTDLALAKYWEDGTTLRMTIGATVAKMLENALLQDMELGDIRTLRKFTKQGTTEVIKQGTETDVWLGKVDGGRCRNNRPTHISVDGLICDIDINGCYGNGLRNQEYPVGNPLRLRYPVKAKNNKYLTLRQFLALYKSDFVDGLWMSRVSTEEGYKLKYSQDFLISWFPPKNLEKLLTDTEREETEWWTDDNTGLTKILTNQVHLALINHDILQIIEHVCSPRQKAELLDNLYVVSALWYPKSNRVETSEELLKQHSEYNGKNTCEIKGRKKKTTILNLEECNAWYGVNLGDLLVDKLMIERSKYNKHDVDKKPFSDLYKLCVNTIYGDQVSPYFEIGNTCVGNNITARARAMAWYMEKGFHGHQSITDGCAFDLNKVIHKRNQEISSETVFEAYLKGTDKGNFTLKPLGESEIKLKISNVVPKIEDLILEQNGKDITAVDLAEMGMRHLQNLFSNVDVLHKKTTSLKGKQIQGQFTLEVKDIFKGASFHGSANYIFKKRDNNFDKAKMRSYSKDNRTAVALVENEIKIIDTVYAPASDLMQRIHNNPKAVDIGHAFIDKSILKVGTHKQRYYSTYENSPIVPGDTIERVRIMRLFSLNQFTFKTMEQYQSWEREHQKYIRELGWSYETFYVTSDYGAVNYEEMVKDIDCCIRNGGKSIKSIKKVSDILKNKTTTLQSHPALNTVKRLRKIHGVLLGTDIEVECDGEISNEYICFDEK